MTNERTAYGAPLDPQEAALLAALRARGLNELAEMALYCFGESYGHAPTALREFEAAPARSPTGASLAEHYGPVGAEPNRCNWMRGDGRCSLPYPHDGRPHQVGAKETEPVP